eukprot:TRINITY_DN10180_c0_g1_i1.p1 TRINITY_DN10180_c0_g1~~TRINITY_DN10180_c0_g1_i1.p1  ORF type:complete len:248 (+),score=82.57 TRINITY_DN10180_c0_g1_i1:495-1238(+)
MVMELSRSVEKQPSRTNRRHKSRFPKIVLDVADEQQQMISQCCSSPSPEPPAVAELKVVSQQLLAVPVFAKDCKSLSTGSTPAVAAAIAPWRSPSVLLPAIRKQRPSRMVADLSVESVVGQMSSTLPSLYNRSKEDSDAEEEALKQQKQQRFVLAHRKLAMLRRHQQQLQQHDVDHQQQQQQQRRRHINKGLEVSCAKLPALQQQGKNNADDKMKGQQQHRAATPWPMYSRSAVTALSQCSRSAVTA